MRITKYRDIFSGILFLILSAIIMTSSYSIKTTIPGRLGAEFMPQVVAIIMGLLSILLIATGLLTLKKQSAETSETINKKDLLQVLALLTVVTIYVLILKRVGFIISSMVFLFAAFTVMSPKEKRKYLLFGILSVVLSIGIYYLFRYVFLIFLPAGIFSL
jgi:uncharacterized membrane protein